MGRHPKVSFPILPPLLPSPVLWFYRIGGQVGVSGCLHSRPPPLFLEPGQRPVRKGVNYAFLLTGCYILWVSFSFGVASSLCPLRFFLFLLPFLPPLPRRLEPERR